MEMPSANWLHELDVHHPEMKQAQPLEDSLSIEDYAPWSISQGSSTVGVSQHERWSTSCTNQRETFLSFGGNPGSSDDGLELYRSAMGEAVEARDEMESVITCSNTMRLDDVTLEEHGKSKQHLPRDHAIAERKRRERLNQHFVELSAIIPGLKKIDKATLLRDAISYVKELEEKVKNLEENVEETIKPLTFYKMSCNPIDNNTLTDFDEPSCEPVLRIDAKLTGRVVLLRIYCEKRKGILVKVFSEVEKLHLNIISTNSMPFQGSFHNISITAEIEEGFNLTVHDLEMNLNSAFCQFM